MLKHVNSSQALIACRLVELLEANVPWHRSLWSVSLGLSIRELREASKAAAHGVLSEGAIRRLGSSCIRLAGKDPVFSSDEKSTINEQLRSPLRAEGIAYFAIGQIADEISKDYLLRWAGLLRNSPAVPDSELPAGNIVAYLLDAGFSDTYLYAWFRKQIHGHSARLTLADLCELAHHEFVLKHQTSYEVLVAFQKSPRSASGYPENWRSAAEISQWLRANAFSVAGVRPSGGFLLQIEAKDPFAAANSARALVDRYVARASIAAGQTLAPWPSMWVRGCPEPFRYESKQRGVRVKALYREDQIFSEPKASNVDAAIELLAHLENSSPSAAIAGGWAAIEALLGEPGDRASASDSLAALVACSIPRAELTLLSYSIEKNYREIADKLVTLQNNRERAALCASVIQNEKFGLPNETDQAAIGRLRNLFKDPIHHLGSLQQSLADSFHRLYRQRNLILHGGITNSVALPASLRTASKIAGAGMDRVAHGFYVQNLQPLELAARAKVALALVQPGDPVGYVDLLGA